MFRSCLVGITLFAMLGTACSRDRGSVPGRSAPGEGGGLSGAANPPSATATTEKPMSAAQQQFIQKAAQGNEKEVDLAKMAQDKAQDSQLKDYAKQLEQDHSDALDDLKRIANKANITIDTTPAAEKASNSDRLNAATGRNFDRAYINMMIDDHQKDIAEFEREQENATGDLKEFIDKTLPVMREHLQKAEDLQKNLKTAK